MYRTRLFFSCTILLISSMSNVLHADQLTLDEQNLKVLFLLNIVRFSEWPVLEQVTTNLNICHRDTSTSFKRALKPLEQKTVHGFNLRGITIDQNDDINDCHVLYIGSSGKLKVAEYLPQVSDNNILTVSEIGGFASRGGMVELYKEKQQIKLIINMDAVRKENIKLSSKLLKFSTVLREEEGIVK